MSARKIYPLFIALILLFVLLLSPQQVLAVSLSINPVSGPVGTEVTLSGSGFTSSTGVTVTWDGGNLSVSNSTADGSGNYSATATVPSGASEGDHTIRVVSVSGVVQAEKSWLVFLNLISHVRAVGGGDPPSAEAIFTVTTSGGGDQPAPTPDDGSQDDQTPTQTPTTPGSTDKDLSNVQTVKGTAASVDKSKSSITVDKEEALANGEDKITISLILMDSKERVIEGLEPEIAVSGSENTVSAIEYKDKKYVATLSSTTAEEKEISAKVGKIEFDKIKVRFIAETVETAPTATTETAAFKKCQTFWQCWWWLLLLILLLILIIAVYLYYRYKKARRELEKQAS